MNSRKKVYEIFVVLCLLIIGLGFVFRQDIFDWYQLRYYDPPRSIEKIANTTTMTKLGKRYFYVTRPEIVSGNLFNEKCREGSSSEFSIILGCYINPGGIYLYRVNDKRLDGIIEVTAAHEMLHSAYGRLSSDKKSEVDKMLQKAYLNVKDDRIRRTIEQYKQQDPSSVPNELHSILGTEVVNLPQELENYYKQYFQDRTVITDLSSGYESEFSSRQAKAEQIGLQLSGQKAEIDSEQQLANRKRNELLSEKNLLDGLLADGKTEEYNSRVDSFNSSIAQYNSLVKHIQSKITSYNLLVAEYQEVSVEINDLYQSIDSRPKSL